MTILGHTVTDQGDIQPDHQKLETITQSPKQTRLNNYNHFYQQHHGLGSLSDVSQTKVRFYTV